MTVAVLSLVSVPLALLASGPLRIALGLLFVLFFPGYALIAALFPRKGALDGIERVALSFGLSLAVVPLIGLALNFTPWGIRLEPILLSLLGFILAMVAVAFYRRRRLLPEERFEVNFRFGLSRLALGWRRQGRWDRLLSVLLALAVIGALGTLVYAIQTPRAGERFTEFYILGPGGKVEDYPGKVMLGEKGQVIVGIANQERQSAVYRVEISIDRERVGEVGPITLEHEEKWEREVGFAPAKAGPKQRVEFRLYRGEGGEPYRTLHLWVDVGEKQT